MSGKRIYIDREGMRRAMEYYPTGEHFAGPIPIPDESLQNEHMPALQISLLLFATATIALYILIISLILLNRKRKSVFRGSFFRLVVSYFIADFIFFLEFNIFFRLRKYGYLNWVLEPGTGLYDVLPAVSNSFHYYIKVVIYMGQVLFATNRLSSAIMIMKYEQYWTNRLIWACRIGQFTLPLLAILPLCPLVNNSFWARYLSFPDQNTLRLETDNVSTAIIAYVDAGCSAAANIICFGMYVATFILLRKEYKNHTTKQSVRNMELRLLAAALLMFIVLTLNTIVQVLTIIANFGEVDEVMFVNDISYPIVDFMYSCQPWALLLTSSVVRNRIKELVTSRDISSTETTAAVKVLTQHQ